MYLFQVKSYNAISACLLGYQFPVSYRPIVLIENVEQESGTVQKRESHAFNCLNQNESKREKTMNSEQIRKMCLGDNIFSNMFAQADQPVLYLLRELTAQVAELNETIKAKQLTASCDAHLHVYGDDPSSQEGLK